MRSRLSTIAVVASVALLVQGCNLSPTAPKGAKASDDGIQSVTGAKKGGGKPHGQTGTFSVAVVSGASLAFLSAQFSWFCAGLRGCFRHTLVACFCAVDNQSK